VDTHIHSWHPHYAQGFDIVLVSLRDHIPLFLEGRLDSEQVWWSPPYARDSDGPRPPDPQQPVWDLLFVGTVDATPERCRFMLHLGELFSGLHAQRGNYQELFPQGKLILNHAVNQDLNFRVFEALGSGTCLLTPQVGHGLVELFQDGRDLFLFPQDDLSALAALAHNLLADPERCRRTAASGLAAVNAGHRARHRALSFSERILSLFASGKAQELSTRRLACSASIHKHYLRLLYLLHAENSPLPAVKGAYLTAAGNRI
jgi:hypothetical protein